MVPRVRSPRAAGAGFINPTVGRACPPTTRASRAARWFLRNRSNLRGITIGAGAAPAILGTLLLLGSIFAMMHWPMVSDSEEEYDLFRAARVLGLARALGIEPPRDRAEFSPVPMVLGLAGLALIAVGLTVLAGTRLLDRMGRRLLRAHGWDRLE